MDLKGVVVAKLRRCPACESEQLVVVLYGLDKDPLGGIPTLECEGCCSVVKELTAAEVASMRKTEEGLAIINRELTR